MTLPEAIEFYDGEITLEDQISFAEQEGDSLTAGILKVLLNGEKESLCQEV